MEAVEEDEYVQVGVCHRLEHVWMAFVEEVLSISHVAGHDGLPHLLPCRQLLSLLLWPAVACAVPLPIFSGKSNHILRTYCKI